MLQRLGCLRVKSAVRMQLTQLECQPTTKALRWTQSSSSIAKVINAGIGQADNTLESKAETRVHFQQVNVIN